jgi:hypothetical protein
MTKVLVRVHVSDTLKHFGHDDKVLTPGERRDVIDLMRLLSPFAKAIRIMEGENYTTISSYIPTVLGLGAFLSGDTNVKWDGCSPVVNSVREALLAELVVPGCFLCFNCCWYLLLTSLCVRLHRKVRRDPESFPVGFCTRSEVQKPRLPRTGFRQGADPSRTAGRRPALEVIGGRHSTRTITTARQETSSQRVGHGSMGEYYATGHSARRAREVAAGASGAS